MKRKLGKVVGGGDENPAPKKRQRLKTFQMCMMVDNILRHSCKQSLAKYQVKKNEAGEFIGNPFAWSHLSLACDMGPDMVASEHFLAYQLQINLSANWDLSHAPNNSSKPLCGALFSPSSSCVIEAGSAFSVLGLALVWSLRCVSMRWLFSLFAVPSS